MKSLQHLAQRLKQGETLTGDDIVALILVLAMALSIAHLLTMLITRWGDRNTALKSLMASLLIHGVCLLGLEVFDPSPGPVETKKPVNAATEELLTEAIVETSDNIPLSGNESSAAVDRPNQPDIQLERFEPDAPEMVALATPERIAVEQELPSPEIRDVSQFRQQPMHELEQPKDPLPEGTQRQNASDPAAELVTEYESRPEKIIPPRLPAAVRTEQAQSLDLEAGPTDPGDFQGGEFEIAIPDVSIAGALSGIVSGLQIPEQPAPFDSMQPPSRSTDPAAMDVGNEVPSAESPDKAVLPRGLQARLPRMLRTVPERMNVERSLPSAEQKPSLSLPLSELYEGSGQRPGTTESADAIAAVAAMSVPELPVIRRPTRPPELYRLRDQQTRRETATRFGGTQESEKAVERSLVWLASIQSSDGRWDASDYGSGLVEVDENGVNRGFAGREADTGITALVMLCFLGAGYTQEQGPYAIQVDHALDWLIRQQGSDGNLCGKAEHYARMYCHAMATYALAEALGMQKGPVSGPILDPQTLSAGVSNLKIAATLITSGSVAQPGLVLCTACTSPEEIAAEKAAGLFRKVDDSRLRAALARAVQFTISQQDPVSGGWRYRPAQEGDVSMFGWHLMSLKSAEMAGLNLPASVRQRMQAFLKLVAQGDHGGLYGYRRNVVTNGQNSERVTPAMTAEALFCHQMLGNDPNSAATREAIDFLVRNPPTLAKKDFYYWYYGTLAMYQHGGSVWRQWNERLREQLLSEQTASGPFLGSWEPTDPWGRYGGRLYSTALATLTLEVYYRFLPLYRMNIDPGDQDTGRQPLP